MDNHQLGLYQSHKQVRAVKIDRVHELKGGSGLVIPMAGKPFIVTPNYLSRHKPTAGGYYVRYKDGYESFSPAEAFEEGYTLLAEGTDEDPNPPVEADEPTASEEPAVPGALVAAFASDE